MATFITSIIYYALYLITSLAINVFNYQCRLLIKSHLLKF